MVHGFYFSKLLLLSTLILRIQMPVILSFFITRGFYARCAAHHTDLFQIMRSRENHKVLKDNQG